MLVSQRQHPPVQEMFSRKTMFTKPHTTRERGKGNSQTMPLILKANKV